MTPMSLSSSLSTSGMPRGDAEDEGAALTWVRQSLAQRRSARAASANTATARASQSRPLSLTTHRSVDFDLSGVCAASTPSSSAMAAAAAAPASTCAVSEPLSAAPRMRYSCAGLDAGRGARPSSALEGGLPLSGSPAPSLAPSTPPVAVSWVLQPPPLFNPPPAPALSPSLASAAPAAPVTSPPPPRRITVYAGFLPHKLDAHDLAAAVFPRSASTATLTSGAAGNSPSNSPMSHASQAPPSPHAVSSELSHVARGGLRAAPLQQRPPRVHSNSTSTGGGNARRGTELLLQQHDTSASSAVNSNTTTTATTADTTMMMGSSSGGSPKHSRDAYDETLAEAMVSTMARMVESERRRESSSAAAAVGGADGGVGGTFLYQPSPPQPPLSPQQQHQQWRPSRRHEPSLYPSGPSTPALTLGSAQSGAGGGVDAAAWDSTSTQSPRGGSPLTPFTRHAAEAAVAAAAAARRGDVAGVVRVDNALVDADGGVNASSTRGTSGALSRPSVVSAAVSVHRLRRRHSRRASDGAAAAGSRNANSVWASEASSSDADAEEHDADAPAARALPRSRLSATTTAIGPVPVAAAAAAPIAGTHEGTTSRKRTSLAATTGTSPRASLTASTLDDAPQLSHHQLTDAFYCSYKGADMARDAYRYFISQQQPPSMQEQQQQQQPQRRGTATQRPPKHPRPSRSVGRSKSTSGSIAQAPRPAAAAAAAAASSTSALDPAPASRRVPTISTTRASLPSGSGAGRRSVTVAAGARAGRANITSAAASITHAVPPQSDPAAVAFEAPLWLRSGAPLHAHHQHRPSSSSSPASASVPIYAAGGAGSTWRTPLRSASLSTSSSTSASLRHSHELHLKQQQQRTSSSSSNWSPPPPPHVQPQQRPRRPSAPHTPGSEDAPSPPPVLRRPSQAPLDELSNAAPYRCAAALDASGTSSDGDVGPARRAPLQVPHLEATLHGQQRETAAGAARRSSAHGVAGADTRGGKRRPSARSPGGDGRKSPAVPPLSALAVSLTTAAAGHPTGQTVACPRDAAAAAATCAADPSGAAAAQERRRIGSAPAHLAPLVPAAAGNGSRARPATALAAAAATTTGRPAAMKPVKLSRRVSTAVPDATPAVGGVAEPLRVAPFAAQLSAPQVQGGRSAEVGGGGGDAGARRGAAPHGDLAPLSHATPKGSAAADRIQALLRRSVCIFEEAQQQDQQQSLHP